MLELIRKGDVVFLVEYVFLKHIKFEFTRTK